MHGKYFISYFLMQLLKYKCPVNGVNKHGNTALHYACFWNSEESAEVGMSNGTYMLSLNVFLNSCDKIYV